MRRLAELPSPWRYLLLALVALGLWFVLRWIDRDDELDDATYGARVAIHVKLRPGCSLASAASSNALAIEPVFAHHAATTHDLAAGDPRDLWLRISVPERAADRELALLEADPG